MVGWIFEEKIYNLVWTLLILFEEGLETDLLIILKGSVLF